MPAKRSVARTGLILAATLVMCRIASLGKEILVAGRFGAGDAIDAYALALLVPALALALYLSAVRRGYLVEAPRHLATDQLQSFTNRYLVQVLLFSAALTALAWGLLVGITLQAIVLAQLVQHTGHRFQFPSGSPLKGAAGFVAVVVPFLWLDAIGQLNVLVDRAMASGLPEGRLSVLYWAALGKDFLSATLVASTLWVLLPRFSEQVATGDHDGLRHSCSRLIRFAAVLLLPASALVLLAGHSLLPTLSLNALDQQDCQRLGWTLGGYAWGLFPEMAGLALVQAVLVLGRFKHLAVIGLLGLFLPNLILNLLLINPLQELGLALSTSATAWLLLAVAWWAVQTTIGLDDPKGILLAVVFAAALSLVALLAGWATANALGPHPLAALTAIAVAATTYLALALTWPGLPDLKIALQTWRTRDHA